MSAYVHGKRHLRSKPLRGFDRGYDFTTIRKLGRILILTFSPNRLRYPLIESVSEICTVKVRSILNKIKAPVYRSGEDVYWRFNNKEVLESRELLSESQWWGPKQLTEYQNERLSNLISHAYESVPYYREKMDERGISTKDIKTIDDLFKLPILTRDVLQSRFDDLRSQTVSQHDLIYRETGGTTGEPVQVISGQNNYAFEKSAQLRGRGFSGWRRGKPMLVLTGGSVIEPKDQDFVRKIGWKLSGRVFMPAFEMSEDNIGEYAQTIERHNIEFIRGYSSSIYQLAHYLQQSDYNVSVDGVLPTADVLYENQRKVIEEELGDVYKYYTATEISSLAYQCEHSKYHISDEHVFIEVLNDGERVGKGERGALVITTLQNYAMPLIRYKIGDVGKLGGNSCPCGRNLTQISELSGRTTDFLKAQDGRLVSGLFIPHIFRKTKTIEQVQVCQPSEDRIIVNIVRGDNYDDSEIDMIREVLIEYLGNLDIEINYTDSIRVGESGKRRFVISEIEEGF